MVVDRSNIRPLRRSESIVGLHGRWKTSWPAVLRTTSVSIPCIIENISRGGAQLVIGPIAIKEEDVALHVAELGAFNGRIVWRRQERVGIQFAAGQLWIVDVVKKIVGDQSPVCAR